MLFFITAELLFLGSPPCKGRPVTDPYIGYFLPLVAIMDDVEIKFLELGTGFVRFRSRLNYNHYGNLKDPGSRVRTLILPLSQVTPCNRLHVGLPLVRTSTIAGGYVQL